MSPVARILLAATLAAAVAVPVSAAPRLYRGENVWYTVSGGVIAYSVFHPDGPDGARSYGADAGAEAIYAKVKATAPPSLTRLGATPQPATGCTEEVTRNAVGASGWAFTCLFPLTASAPAPAASEASGAPQQVVATAPPKPASPPPAAARAAVNAPPSPTVVMAAAAPKPTAPPPAGMPLSTIPATAPTPALVAAAAGGDAYLNARVKAELDAVEARNTARKNEFEQAKNEFEAAKKASEATYAAQVAAYQAQVKETERRRQADLAAWQARVAACKAGDTSQCGE